jgi:hypothetical protein
MKRIFAFVIPALICAAHLYAGQMKVEAYMAKDEDGEEKTTTFGVDAPTVYAHFKTEGSAKGDKLRSVWIAEDVGDVAPAGTKIDEASVTVDGDDFEGKFSLSKPNNGWPVGKYRVDIYAGDDVVTSLKFTISKDEKSEAGEEKSSED